MREIIGCLNIYRYENRSKNIYPHQSKIKDFCQLPLGEAFVNNNLYLLRIFLHIQIPVWVQPFSALNATTVTTEQPHDVVYIDPNL